jgi:hypothetical protein
VGPLCRRLPDRARLPQLFDKYLCLFLYLNPTIILDVFGYFVCPVFMHCF